MRLRPGTQDRATLSEVRAYRPLGIRSGDVVLDLGGCVGAFGREAVAAGAARVVAVEPEPSNVSLYRLNVPEATVLLAAVGRFHDDRTLWLGSTNSHSLIHRRGRQAGPTVHVYPLGSLIASFEPTIIKADIEGSEYEVDWSRLGTCRALAIEFHFTPKKQWREQYPFIVSQIEAQGFKPTVPVKDTGKNWHSVGIWHREVTA